MAKQYSTEPNSRATQIKPHCSYFKAFTVQPQQQQQLQQQSTPPEAASVAAGIKMPLKYKSQPTATTDTIHELQYHGNTKANKKQQQQHQQKSKSESETNESMPRECTEPNK